MGQPYPTLPPLSISYVRLLVLQLQALNEPLYCPAVGQVVSVTSAISAPLLTGGTCNALRLRELLSRMGGGGLAAEVGAFLRVSDLRRELQGCTLAYTPAFP